ncbi:hypothetical protein ACIPRL_36480 [Streptomyces sp. NPDC090085]|uniref:hypothetical protein n=1 Tax=Streptomyces sp. NPDC090085 TaxID=3365943 RepID=UPI0037FD2B8F
MDLSYQAWQRALADAFFGPQHAGHPTLLYVDSDVEQELMRRGGIGVPLAESVGLAVRAADPDPYAEIENHRWRVRRQDRDGVPAFLPLLACSVLAATRMVHDQHHRASAYHARFSELLTGDPGLLRSSNYEPVARMWQALASWQHSQNGARGLCTIPSPRDLAPNRSRIGFALSQALLSGRDRSQLPDIFAALRNYNGDSWPLPGDALLGALEIRHWEQRFSSSFRRAATEEEFRPLIARLLGNYAATWDGSAELVPTGLPRAELLVQLDAGRLSWVARSSSADADRIVLPDGIVLDRLGDTAYYSVAGLRAPSASGLREGVRLRGHDLVLSRPPTSVLVLARNDVLGVWASTDGFIPGEQHVVLAAPEARSDVQRLLDRAASAGRRQEGSRLAWMPEGWSLHRPVVFDDDLTLRKALHEVQGTVGSLHPSPQFKLRIEGGLRLAPGLDPQLFLTGAEPSVIMPDAAEGNLLLDGAERPELLELAVLGRPVPLAGLGLIPGKHTIGVDGSKVSFTTAASAPFPPAAPQACGFAVAADGVAAAYPAVLAEGAPAVAGADITAQDGSALPRTVLCRRGSDQRLFAASDGRLWNIACPEPPVWWAERLPGIASPLFFEVSLLDVDGWLLERRAGRWRAHPVSPGLPQPGSSARAHIWASAVLTAQEASADPLWTAYVRVAKELER